MTKTIKKETSKALILALIVLLSGVFAFGQPAEAARAKNVKDILTDSRPSTVSNHTVQFITPTGIDHATDTVTLTLDSAGQALDLTNVALDMKSFDLAVNDGTADCGGVFTDQTVASSTAAGTWGVSVATPSDVITFTAPTDVASSTIAADHCLRIEIGTNATSGGAGVQQIINPAAEGVYNIDVAGTFGDVGRAKVSVISGVTVSATVAETLTFAIYSSASANCDTNGGLGSVYTLSSTTTTIPFGSIDNETFYNGCQKLKVITNAKDGYSTTVKETNQLTGAATATEIADGTCDGACSKDAAAVWTDANNNGFGYCMKDVTGNAATTAGWATQCDGTQTFKIFADNAAAQAPVEIMSSATPAGNDQSYISYRLTVDVEQAADDYSNTLIYVTTPQYN